MGKLLLILCLISKIT